VPSEEQTPPEEQTEKARPRRPRRESPPDRDAGSPSDGNGRLRSASAAARAAAAEVVGLTGHRPESVISIERSDGGWKVGVEVVEAERIPDSATILATYEVVLDRGGEMTSYRRTGRHARGQLRERR
jgi:hypothetical protein